MHMMCDVNIQSVRKNLCVLAGHHLNEFMCFVLCSLFFRTVFLLETRGIGMRFHYKACLFELLLTLTQHKQKPFEKLKFDDVLHVFMPLNGAETYAWGHICVGMLIICVGLLLAALMKLVFQWHYGIFFHKAQAFEVKASNHQQN